MRFGAILLCVTMLLPTVCVSQQTILGGRVKLAAPPPTPATYQERCDESPLNQSVTQLSLALPLISALSITPPRQVKIGEVAFPDYSKRKQLYDVTWRIVTWQEKHAEFLRQHSTLKERGKDIRRLELEKMKLIAWCERNKLPHCAEFTLRDYIFTRGSHIMKGQYVRSLQRWRAYAIHHPSPYTFRLPLVGQWHALVDDTKHHQKKHWAVFAFDIVQQRGGRLHVGSNLKENHFAWQQPAVAICDGVIVSAEGKHLDYNIGRPGPSAKANHVQLDCGGGIFADYAHLRQGSVLVKRGDKVKAGQLLARVGNSGASGVPHLHFSMIDRDGLSLAGRYRFRVLATQGWTPMNGQDIREGWNFRDE